MYWCILMKKVYLSILYLTVKELHCKKTVTLAFPQCGEVFVVTGAEKFGARVRIPKRGQEKIFSDAIRKNLFLSSFRNSAIMCSGKLVIDSHVSYSILGKSHHPIRKSTPFFDVRLSSTTSTKYSWWVHFSKRFLLVRVVWDFLLTDFPPACRVALDFLPVSPYPTLPFARFVVFPGITTFSVCLRVRGS